MKVEPAYRREAKRRWRNAEWISGNGRYATLSTCYVTTVCLWPTLEEAVKGKKWIDDAGCGGKCCKRHSIVDLHKWGVA